MAQTPIWKSIQDTLSADIANGHYAQGDKLPEGEAPAPEVAARLDAEHAVETFVAT